MAGVPPRDFRGVGREESGSLDWLVVTIPVTLCLACCFFYVCVRTWERFQIVRRRRGGWRDAAVHNQLADQSGLPRLDQLGPNQIPSTDPIVGPSGEVVSSGDKGLPVLPEGWWTVDTPFEGMYAEELRRNSELQDKQRDQIEANRALLERGPPPDITEGANRVQSSHGALEASRQREAALRGYLASITGERSTSILNQEKASLRGRLGQVEGILRSLDPGYHPRTGTAYGGTPRPPADPSPTSSVSEGEEPGPSRQSQGGQSAHTLNAPIDTYGIELEDIVHDDSSPAYPPPSYSPPSYPPPG